MDPKPIYLTEAFVGHKIKPAISQMLVKYASD